MLVLETVPAEEADPLTQTRRYGPSKNNLLRPHEIPAGERVLYASEGRHYAYVYWRERLYRVPIAEFRSKVKLEVP